MGASKLKRFVIPSCIIALVLVLSVALLSGCAGANKEKVIGTWTGTTEVTGSDGLKYNQEYTISFSENDSFVLETSRSGRWLGLDYGGGACKGTWKIRGNQVIMHVTDKNTNDMHAVLSDDGSTLNIGDGAYLYKQ